MEREVVSSEEKREGRSSEVELFMNYTRDFTIPVEFSLYGVEVSGKVHISVGQNRPWVLPANFVTLGRYVRECFSGEINSLEVSLDRVISWIESRGMRGVGIYVSFDGVARGDLGEIEDGNRGDMEISYSYHHMFGWEDGKPSTS